MTNLGILHGDLAIAIHITPLEAQELWRFVWYLLTVLVSDEVEANLELVGIRGAAHQPRDEIRQSYGRFDAARGALAEPGLACGVVDFNHGIVEGRVSRQHIQHCDPGRVVERSGLVARDANARHSADS